MRAVLTFHRIDDRAGALSFTPQRLNALLDALAARNIPVVDLATLLAPGTTHGVTLTFDDGYRTLHDAALPMLRERNLPTHLFLSTGWIDGEVSQPAPRAEALTWDMVERLHGGGVRIESHTHRHPDLRTLGDAAIDDECSAADEAIERKLGRRPRYFAYPFGYHDARVVSRIATRYDAAFTTELRALSHRDVAARLPRLDAHYLRSPLIYARLEGPLAHAYLELRRWGRMLRGAG